MDDVRVLVLAAAGAVMRQVSGAAATPDGKGFPSADAAAQALVTAAKNGDVAGLIEILGASAKSIGSTRAPVGDRESRQTFSARAGQQSSLDPNHRRQTAKEVSAGKEGTPVPH